MLLNEQSSKINKSTKEIKPKENKVTLSCIKKFHSIPKIQKFYSAYFSLVLIYLGDSIKFGKFVQIFFILIVYILCNWEEIIL